MAASSSDVNVKEGKKGKERTEMERKLATYVGERKGKQIKRLPNFLGAMIGAIEILHWDRKAGVD